MNTLLETKRFYCSNKELGVGSCKNQCERCAEYEYASEQPELLD